MQRPHSRFLLLAAAALVVWPGSALVAQDKLATPEPLPVLEGAPRPEFCIQPGLEGIFSELRAAAKLPQKLNRRRVGRRLELYRPYESRVTPSDLAAFNIRQIVVKFVEGSSVRLREGALLVSADSAALETRARLARRGLEPQTVAGELVVLGKLLKTSGAVVGRAAPRIDELDLMRLRQRAELNTGREQPDLNLFYFAHLPKTGAEAAQRMLADLKRLRIIETAYFQPIPVNAQDKPPPTTISVINEQGYFGLAPGGIDVDFARNFAGGRGEGVRIADIEYGWHFLHEDLPPTGFGFGINFSDSHGTAVLGQIAAVENGFGATGIVPNAMIGWSSTTSLDPFGPIYFYSVGNALLMTSYALRRGDIALIEQQFTSGATLCNPVNDPCLDCDQFGMVAVEEFAYEHAAISSATGAGVIVVEAAGNGRTLVTPASPTDSGAIVVGASNAGAAGSDLTPACFTNSGPRVNVHSWGAGIGTTGYGGTPTVIDPTLRANGADVEQWYTRRFGGTSGASPIVTGAAALIQSIRAASGLPKLTSVEMRTLLVATGVPQAAGSTRTIGAHPNLRAAIASFNPDAARFVSQSAVPSGPLAPGAGFPMLVTFANSGGVTWQGAHTMSIAPSSGGQQQFAGAPVILGTPTPINPGQSTTRQFPLNAPTQPGTYSLAFVLRSGSGQVLAASPTQHIVVTAPNTLFDNSVLTIKSSPGSLPSGQGGIVVVTARNTGTTTWTPANYSLRLQRSNRISLPQTSFVFNGSVAPGASQDIGFVVICSGSGQGSFSARVSGPGGPFGQSVGRTVVCQ